jgi:hypothetical protein
MDRTAEHEAWRKRWLPRLDIGISPYVDALRAADIETFESCEGGDGHAYPQPTIRFAGGPEEGFRALAVALRRDFPVWAIRRYWVVRDGEPCGPDWEMTFREACPTGFRTLGIDADQRLCPPGSAQA